MSCFILTVGEGEYVFASGDRYFGTFENDYKHGTGVQHYIGKSEIGCCMHPYNDKTVSNLKILAVA